MTETFWPQNKLPPDLFSHSDEYDETTSKIWATWLILKSNDAAERNGDEAESWDSQWHEKESH